MQIRSIIDIIDGVLLNSPSISFIYNIKSHAKRIIEGDLFIAKNPEDIPKAIQNGAFAIVIEEHVPVTDNEIAWIKVNNLDETLIKLFRYKLSTIELKVFYCDSISFDILKLYKNINKNVKFIENDLYKSIKVIEELSAEDILFCANKTIIDKIYPNNHQFNKTYVINNLIKHSLFETTFSYKEYFFSKLKLPSLYINQFLDVFEFLGLSLDENRLKRLSTLKPIFIDKFLSIIEFGKSNTFILTQTNTELIYQEISYLQQHYTYAKIACISKYDVSQYGITATIVPSTQTLLNYLKQTDFNCLYIIGYDFDEVEYLLCQSSQQQTLL